MQPNTHHEIFYFLKIFKIRSKKLNARNYYYPWICYIMFDGLRFEICLEQKNRLTVDIHLVL